MDNGPPWGNRQHLPSALTLWLVGLDIEVIHNRPYSPTENGRVERTHGTVKRWVEPAECENFEGLISRLDRAAQIQRECYPSCAGQSRLHYYPALATKARRYDAQFESHQWDFSKVCQFLAQYRWSRKVSKTGQVSLYNRNYSAGRAFAGQMVSVRLDAKTHHWVMEDLHGQLISRRPFKQFSAHAVQTLSMTRRKRPQKKRSRRVGDNCSTGA